MRSASPSRGRFPARTRALLVIAVLAVSVTGLFAATAASAQDGTGGATEPVPSTVHQLLAGPTTAAPTSAAPTSSAVSSTGSVTTKSADTKKVWAVVAALVLVALCLLGLTLVYVRRTKPAVEPSSGAERTRPPSAGGASEAKVTARPPVQPSRTGQARRSAAGAPGSDPARSAERPSPTERRSAPGGPTGRTAGPKGRANPTARRAQPPVRAAATAGGDPTRPYPAVRTSRPPANRRPRQVAEPRAGAPRPAPRSRSGVERADGVI